MYSHFVNSLPPSAGRRLLCFSMLMLETMKVVDLCCISARLRKKKYIKFHCYTTARGMRVAQTKDLRRRSNCRHGLASLAIQSVPVPTRGIDRQSAKQKKRGTASHVAPSPGRPLRAEHCRQPHSEDGHHASVAAGLQFKSRSNSTD